MIITVEFIYLLFYIFYYNGVNINIYMFIVYNSGRKGAQLAAYFQNNQQPISSPKEW